MYIMAPKIEAVIKDTLVVNITEKIALNRDEWRKGIVGPRGKKSFIY